MGLGELFAGKKKGLFAPVERARSLRRPDGSISSQVWLICFWITEQW
jgi:hypothetical protein